MELRQLRYFVKAARTLNFSEAAKQLAITQSTLSQQIRQLETEMDTQLFRRDSHRVQLTEEGEALLPYAVATLSSAETCMERLRDLRHLAAGTLNIGVTYSFSPILTETVIAFMKRYPKVKLNIYYKTMEELMEMLTTGEVDFVLAFRPSVQYDGIESHELFDNRLAVIVREGHLLCRQASVKLHELEKFDMALPSKGLQARNALDAIIAGRHLNYHVRIELNEVNILLKLVKNTDLVTILSEATIHDTPNVRAILLDTKGETMAGCIHMLKGAYRKHSATEFMRMLCESDAVRFRRNSWVGN